LENRILLSSPTLSATPASSSEIDLSYVGAAGEELELEELAPGYLNYQTISGFVPSSTGSGTYDLTGLQANTHYSFRLRAVDGSGNVQYATSFARTTGGSLPVTLAVPTNVRFCLIRVVSGTGRSWPT
jgi:hypothetical protein